MINKEYRAMLERSKLDFENPPLENVGAAGIDFYEVAVPVSSEVSVDGFVSDRDNGSDGVETALNEPSAMQTVDSGEVGQLVKEGQSVSGLAVGVDSDSSAKTAAFEVNTIAAAAGFVSLLPDTGYVPPKFTSCADGARFWFTYGFKVMPILQASKSPAFKFELWLTGLSLAKIAAQYAKNKYLEVGFVVGDTVIVLDADSPESEKALIAIELEYGVSPKLVVKTKRGCHHYFQLAPGVFARSDAHSTVLHPDRLDVKTGKGIIILPPSVNKEIVVFKARNASELSVVGQDFVDAIAEHNGRQVPRPSAPSTTVRTEASENASGLTALETLLNHIDPSCGYADWLRVLMVVFHETGGSDDGLALVDRWSSKGGSYKGIQDIETHWRSFKSDVANPVTVGSLIKMARDAGADIDVATLSGESFEDVGQTVVIEPGSRATAKNSVMVSAKEPIVGAPKVISVNPLEKYFIHDLAELERQAVNQVLILGSIILMGQASVIYAKQNTGKTLIILALIIAAIKAGKFDPSMLIYLNMDDDSNGLAVKAGLAKEFGFRMVADGHHGFEA